ncbi:hypothetical protein Tco_1494611 [Tanacetum coccineum]
MLASMTLELQSNMVDFNAYDMLKELKTMFSQQADHELLETMKAFHTCNMGKTIDDLHAMLKLHENRLPKKADVAHVVLAIKGGKIQKNNKNKKLQAAHRKGLGKGKDKLAYSPKPNFPITKEGAPCKGCDLPLLW